MARSKAAVEKAVALMQPGEADYFSAASIAPLVADVGAHLLFHFIRENGDAENPTKDNSLVIKLPAQAVDEMMVSLVKLHAARLRDARPRGNA